MSDPEIATGYREGDVERLIIRPWLLAGMITVLFVAVFAFLRQIVGTGPWLPLTAMFFLIALESIYTTQWLNHPDRRLTSKWSYRAAELAMLLLLVRLFTWPLLGDWPQWQQWRQYALDPSLLIGLPFLAVAVGSWLAWYQGMSLETWFLNLRLNEGELQFYLQASAEPSTPLRDRPSHVNRGYYVERYTRWWVIAGSILVLFAGLSNYGIGELSFSLAALRTITRLGLPPEMIFALLFFFTVGLWLLSRARLSALNTRWVTNQIQVDPGVSRIWNRSTLLLIIAIAFAAAFLPIGSTLGISRILAFALLAIYAFVQFILLFFVAIIAFLVGLFAGVTPETETTIAPPELQLPEPDTASLFTLSEDAVVLLGTLFWIVVLGALIAAAIFFIRGRGYPLDMTTVGRLLRVVRKWLLGIWRGVGDRVEMLGAAVKRLNRPPITTDGGVTSRWRFLRINSLSPRGQIRYFYLSTLRRASDRGVNRQESETPREFLDSLVETWPEAEQDISQLTDAFQEARYNRRPIPANRLDPIKAAWKRIRSNFNRRSKPDVD